MLSNSSLNQRFLSSSHILSNNENEFSKLKSNIKWKFSEISSISSVSQNSSFHPNPQTHFNSFLKCLTPRTPANHARSNEKPTRLLSSCSSSHENHNHLNNTANFKNRQCKFAFSRFHFTHLSSNTKAHKLKASNREAAPKNELDINSSPLSDDGSSLKSNTWLDISHLILPRYAWRAIATLIMAGQVFARVISGRIHFKNFMIQLNEVGPGSLGVSLLTACFVGMAFTIQFVREFTRLGLTRSVGGVLSLALSRELSPVVTAIIMAGRVGSAFAAELGTMQVSEQTDTLRVLRTDPVDYLVTPRVISCCVALPVLTLFCFTVGMAASVLLADGVYNVSANIILDSAARALQPWDIFSMMIKSTVFGGIISCISCGWGLTTSGGAKGVGESTTSAVVISLVCTFIADFFLSWFFFQGAGDALKAAMG